jgi:hypothetical protein
MKTRKTFARLLVRRFVSRYGILEYGMAYGYRSIAFGAAHKIAWHVR